MYHQQRCQHCSAPRNIIHSKAQPQPCLTLAVLGLAEACLIYKAFFKVIANKLGICKRVSHSDCKNIHRVLRLADVLVGIVHTLSYV